MKTTNGQNDIVQRWRNASVYEHERLGLLKKIAREQWEQLLDRKEQIKFNLASDEFLVYADKYSRPLPRISVILAKILLFFYLPLLVYLKHNRNYLDSEIYILISCIILMFIILYILFSYRKAIGDLFITNKKIFLVNQNESNEFYFDGLCIENYILLCKTGDRKISMLPRNSTDLDGGILSLSNQYIKKTNILEKYG